MEAIAVFDPNSSFNKYHISGTVTFQDVEAGALVTFDLKNLPRRAGEKVSLLGIHVHESGDLSEGCASLCSHFNPTGARHGSYQLHGMDHHAGDLINNLVVGPDRTFSLAWIDPLLTVKPGPLSVVGRSVVIHSGTDDLGEYRDDDPESAKTGNAGARIACAIIGYKKAC